MLILKPLGVIKAQWKSFDMRSSHVVLPSQVHYPSECCDTNSIWMIRNKSSSPGTNNLIRYKIADREFQMICLSPLYSWKAYLSLFNWGKAESKEQKNQTKTEDMWVYGTNVDGRLFPELFNVTKDFCRPFSDQESTTAIALVHRVGLSRFSCTSSLGNNAFHTQKEGRPAYCYRKLHRKTNWKDNHKIAQVVVQTSAGGI